MVDREVGMVGMERYGRVLYTQMHREVTPEMPVLVQAMLLAGAGAVPELGRIIMLRAAEVVVVGG